MIRLTFLMLLANWSCCPCAVSIEVVTTPTKRVSSTRAPRKTNTMKNTAAPLTAGEGSRGVFPEPKNWALAYLFFWTHYCLHSSFFSLS